MKIPHTLVKGFSAVTAAVLLCAATASAQERPASAPSAAAEKESGGKPASDGIKVHGHWTVEVRNADRTLASRNEFENALVPAGAVVLSALLNDELRTAAWFVTVRGNNNEGPCLDTAGPRECVLAQGNSPLFASTTWITKSLSINLRDQSGNYTGTVELSGAFFAAVAVPITLVQASLILADASGVNSTYGFSARSLPVPISVAPGQQVYVTVRFSFS